VGTTHIFPFVYQSNPADALFVTQIVTPHRIVDEVVNIFSTIVRHNGVLDEYGVIRAPQRLYEDVIIEELSTSLDWFLSLDDIQDFIEQYGELVDSFYGQLLQPLSFLLQKHGIDVVEQLRFLRFLNDSIILEIGDAEESACRSVRCNRYSKSIFW